MHVFNAFSQIIKNMQIMNLYRQFVFNKYKDKLCFFHLYIIIILFYIKHNIFFSNKIKKTIYQRDFIKKIIVKFKILFRIR